MYADEMEVPWSERKPPSFALLITAIAFAAATAISIVLIDSSVARTLAEYQPSSMWDTGIEILEWAILLPLHKLALPIALVVAMLLTVFVKRWRAYAPSLMTIAAVHLSTRLVTNWIKDGTGRYRPAEFLKKGVDGSFGWEGGVAFPSGHVVLFASLIIPILYVFPRTRVLAIPLLAILAFVAIARIAVNAHWISDTLGSITLVALVTWAVSWATRPAE
jgi:membrane-associated phospholipid phosphatase